MKKRLKSLKRVKEITIIKLKNLLKKEGITENKSNILLMVRPPDV
ncbi:MAG: hypothetical protein ACOYVK_02665 [Bacillota bacterium]